MQNAEMEEKHFQIMHIIFISIWIRSEDSIAVPFSVHPRLIQMKLNSPSVSLDNARTCSMNGLHLLHFELSSSSSLLLRCNIIVRVCILWIGILKHLIQMIGIERKLYPNMERSEDISDDCSRIKLLNNPYANDVIIVLLNITNGIA